MRIRSIHPAFYTDEDLVTCSAYARLFLTGIWGESDDQGVFEWKPLTLKMRILPADNVRAEDLLDELIKINAIKLIEVDGKKFGLCRNFNKFQHPKKPTIKYPLPKEFRKFVGLFDDELPTSGEEVPHQFPTKEENRLQMDIGREEKKDSYIYPPLPPNEKIDEIKKDDQTIRAVNFYNELANKYHWTTCKLLTDERRTKLGQRIQESGGIDMFETMLRDRAERSDYLQGLTDANFGVHIDFILQKSSFVKLIEGKYDNKNNSIQQTTRIPSNSAHTRSGLVSPVAAMSRVLAAYQK